MYLESDFSKKVDEFMIHDEIQVDQFPFWNNLVLFLVLIFEMIVSLIGIVIVIWLEIFFSSFPMQSTTWFSLSIIFILLIAQVPTIILLRPVYYNLKYFRNGKMIYVRLNERMNKLSFRDFQNHFMKKFPMCNPIGKNGILSNYMIGRIFKTEENEIKIGIHKALKIHMVYYSKGGDDYHDKCLEFIDEICKYSISGEYS